MSDTKPKHKNILFNDDDNSINDEEEHKKMSEHFDKALNKKHFAGKKGKMLLELQSTYMTDPRFVLDKKFGNDVQFKKLPNVLKNELRQQMRSNEKEFNYNDTNINNNEQDELIINEKNKNLSILSSVIPAKEYLEHKPKETQTKKLLMKRFDPLLCLGSCNIQPIEIEKEKKDNNKDDNKIKLEKGVKVFNDALKNPIYDKRKKKEMKKREKEKLMNKMINEINDNMNGEVVVNCDIWKQSIQDKAKGEFKLFGGGDEDGKCNKGEEIKKEERKEIEKEKVEKSDIKGEKKSDKDEEGDGKVNKKKKEKEGNKKQKLLEMKRKREEQNQKMQDLYETDLTERFGEEKANNYIKYINLINEKKKKKNK